MSLLLKIVSLSACRNTHHKLAIDALRHLNHPSGSLWRDLFLKYYESYLLGSKVPDDQFKDFKNHVLHVRENGWGGAIVAARSWFDRTVAALRTQQWSDAVFSAGVMSHYVSDPHMPLHTAQSEDEGSVHRALEWSIACSYDNLRSLLEGSLGGYSEPKISTREDWLATLIRDGAEYSNQHYHAAIDHYNLERGVRNPISGLDNELNERIANCLGRAVMAVSRALDRAFEQARVAPPAVELSLETIVATLKMPVRYVLRSLENEQERGLVQRIYREFQDKGKVIEQLPEDDRIIRQLHARQVLKIPCSELDTRAARAPGSLHGTKSNITGALKRATSGDWTLPPAKRWIRPTPSVRPAPPVRPAPHVRPSTAPRSMRIPLPRMTVETETGSQAAFTIPNDERLSPHEKPMTDSSGTESSSVIPVRHKPPRTTNRIPPTSSDRHDTNKGPPRSRRHSSINDDVETDETPTFQPEENEPEQASSDSPPTESIRAKTARWLHWPWKMPSWKTQRQSAADGHHDSDPSNDDSDQTDSDETRSAEPQFEEAEDSSSRDDIRSGHHHEQSGEEESGENGGNAKDRSGQRTREVASEIEDHPRRQARHAEMRFYLDEDSPIVDAPSIGPKAARRFEAIGVSTIADFLQLDPDSAAERLGVKSFDAETLRKWQAQTRLACRVPGLRGHDAQILVACGITDPDELAGFEAQDLFDLIEPFLNSPEAARLLRGVALPDFDEVGDWIQWAGHARPLRAA